MAEIVYGRHAVYHLLKANRRRTFKLYFQKESELVSDPILTLARERRVVLEPKPAPFFATYDGSQGIVAEVEPYPYQPSEELSQHRLLLCDGIQDPQNLGAICRSAYLLGVGGMIILENRASSVSPGVCKASAGAVEYLQIAKVSSLANAINKLKDKGFWIYGADQEGAKPLYEESFPQKVAVVIGGEGSGLSRLVKERCDITIKIPMVRGEIDSFNASISTALILGEIYRQDLQKMKHTA